jgi:hypothetical protein
MGGLLNTLKSVHHYKTSRKGTKNMDTNSIKIVNAQQANDIHIFNIIKDKLYKTKTGVNNIKNIQIVFMHRRPPVNEVLVDFLHDGAP